MAFLGFLLFGHTHTYMSKCVGSRACDWCHEPKFFVQKVWVSRATYILSDEECDDNSEEDYLPPTGFSWLCVKCTKFNDVFISPRSQKEGQVAEAAK